jgi:predicted transcriptional regulator
MVSTVKDEVSKEDLLTEILKMKSDLLLAQQTALDAAASNENANQTIIKFLSQQADKPQEHTTMLNEGLRVTKGFEANIESISQNIDKIKGLLSNAEAKDHENIESLKELIASTSSLFNRHATEVNVILTKSGEFKKVMGSLPKDKGIGD